MTFMMKAVIGLQVGLAASLIGGQSTGLANRKASRLAPTIAKLDHE